MGEVSQLQAIAELHDKDDDDAVVSSHPPNSSPHWENVIGCSPVPTLLHHVIGSGKHLLLSLGCFLELQNISATFYSNLVLQNITNFSMYQLAF